MNKSELINSISNLSGLSKKDSEAALKAFITSLENTLCQGEKIQLQGFGTFEVKARAERTGVNPRTKEKIVIPASMVPVFKAGKELRNRVNGEA